MKGFLLLCLYCPFLFLYLITIKGLKFLPFFVQLRLAPGVEIIGYCHHLVKKNDSPRLFSLVNSLRPSIILTTW
jgi:hypothetical protein